MSIAKQLLGFAGNLAVSPQQKGVIQQKRDTGNDPDVGEVKDVPVVAGSMKRCIVDHRAINDPVNRVADGPADKHAKGDGRQPVRVAHKPDDQRQGDDGFDRNQEPDLCLTVGGEQAVGDAAVPDQHQVEEWCDDDAAPVAKIEAKKQPRLHGLIDDQADQRNHTAQDKRSAHTATLGYLGHAEFPQSICIAQRDVWKLRIGAHFGQNLP